MIIHTLVEACVLHVLQDSTLVLHLPTSRQSAWWPVHTPFHSKHATRVCTKWYVKCFNLLLVNVTQRCKSEFLLPFLLSQKQIPILNWYQRALYLLDVGFVNFLFTFSKYFALETVYNKLGKTWLNYPTYKSMLSLAHQIFKDEQKSQDLTLIITTHCKLSNVS